MDAAGRRRIIAIRNPIGAHGRAGACAMSMNATIIGAKTGVTTKTITRAAATETMTGDAATVATSMMTAAVRIVAAMTKTGAATSNRTARGGGTVVVVGAAASQAKTGASANAGATTRAPVSPAKTVGRERMSGDGVTVPDRQASKQHQPLIGAA